MLVWLHNVNIAEGIAETVALAYAPGGTAFNFAGYTATWRIIQDGKVWASGTATLNTGTINVPLSAAQTAMPKPAQPQKLNAAGVLEVTATNGSNTLIFNATVIVARREDSDDGLGILSTNSPDAPPSSAPLLAELNLSDLDDAAAALVNLGIDATAAQINAAAVPSAVPYVILIMGQSNAVGVYGGGPNPASALVQTWDAGLGTPAWGGSDYTAVPWSRSTPNGNGGVNNYALARAHRIATDTGREIYIVYDAVSGTSIDQWVASGTSSARYAAAKVKVEAALATLPGKTVVDEIIWAQGEEDFRDGFAEHLGNLTLLRNQFRAETWCNYETPIYMCGPSNLHDRYMWQNAMQYFCASVDNRCIFVPSNGLRTTYDTIGAGTPTPGSGDYTHFLGESVWEMGYYRIADAAPVETPANLYFNRGNGPASAGDTQVISTWDTLISFQSRTGGSGLAETLSGDGSTTVFALDYRGTTISEVTIGGVVLDPAGYTHTGTNDSVAGRSITFTAAPASGSGNVVVSYAFAPNAPGMTGGIGFGYANYPDGNYTYALGYENWTANLCNYTLVAGRDNGALAAADYSAALGYQHLMSAPYTFAAGRGHTPSDDGGAAVGQFSKYVAGESDDVRFQVGTGSSSGARSNGLTVRASGTVEIAAPSTAANPAQNEEIVFKRVNNATLAVLMRGTDGTVRSVNLTLA